MRVYGRLPTYRRRPPLQLESSFLPIMASVPVMCGEALSYVQVPPPATVRAVKAAVKRALGVRKREQRLLLPSGALARDDDPWNGDVLKLCRALPSCSWCATPGAPSLCGACRRVSYCDKVCQTSDWRRHKLCC